MKTMAIAVAAVVLTAAGSASAAVNVWSTTFEAGYFESIGPFPRTSLGVSFGGGSIQGSRSLPGFGGNFFRNDTSGTTTFSTTGLGAHTALELSFDLAFIDSWDSTDGSPAPDLLFVNIDGVTPQVYTTNNASGSVIDYGPGAGATRGSYGFNGAWADAVVHYHFIIPHTSSDWSMAINFGGAGFQGGLDESWGLDNFSLAAVPPVVGGGGVPEPASWALMIAGFGLSGAVLRRRRSVLA